MKNIFFIAFIFISVTSYAQKIDFLCTGTTGGTNIRDESMEVPISVDVGTGDIWNFGAIFAPGCFALGSDKKVSKSCKVNPNEIICTCVNPDNDSSIIKLSRITGNLRVDTIFNKKSWWGYYSCEKITSRKF